MEVVSRPLDWLGINYYTRGIYKAAPTASATRSSRSKVTSKRPRWAGKSIPKGLSDLLVRVSNDYTKIPLYVTENGMAEVEGDADPRRVSYYEEHLKAVLAAREPRAPMCAATSPGRCSTITNGPRATTSASVVVHVDYQTQQRTPKASYRAFQGMLHNTPLRPAGLAPAHGTALHSLHAPALTGAIPAPGDRHDSHAR
jgi:beta-glucosidase